jgi:hypothetical protein
VHGTLPKNRPTFMIDSCWRRGTFSQPVIAFIRIFLSPQPPLHGGPGRATPSPSLRFQVHRLHVPCLLASEPQARPHDGLASLLASSQVTLFSYVPPTYDPAESLDPSSLDKHTEPQRPPALHRYTPPTQHSTRLHMLLALVACPTHKEHRETNPTVCHSFTLPCPHKTGPSPP